MQNRKHGDQGACKRDILSSLSVMLELTAKDTKTKENVPTKTDARKVLVRDS